MEHDHVLKKLNFDLLYPTQGQGGGGRGGLQQNIYYDVAAFMIPYNLMSNITMSHKVKF